MALELQKLVPNARIAIGHAKLEEKELEQIMVDFAERESNFMNM